MPFARHQVIDQVRTWGVPVDDDTADTIQLVASELIANAVIHGTGPVTVKLSLKTGRLVIDVHDGNSAYLQASCAQIDGESGRGLALVELLASRLGWEPSAEGKRVWAEIELPLTAPAIRAAVLRRLFVRRPRLRAPAEAEPLALAVV
ncbi:ATP-binding protein [Streptomyces sp. NPDC047072]|uniref:ATP-binding protein n=1 Tax=Streptomyces sp. NPDC047072 TaxID=3154809 RepID=UPI0033E44E1D